MDFAKKILNKYGWKEGEGLGKNNDGIAKPLKASLKFDNAGFGADQAASDFNNHWWERVFNEAASNVKVAQQENGNIAMELKDCQDSVEITTKGYSVKKLKKAKASGNEGNGEKRGDALYDNFLQSATLTRTGAEIENTEKIATNDIAVTQFKVLSDEELFRACGGRTAHKGARHGLKLSGKLARLQQQEEEMLAKMLAKSVVKELEVDTTTKAKSKKKNKNKSDEVAIVQEQLQDSTVPDQSVLPEKPTEELSQEEVIVKKKKKSKRKEEDANEPKKSSNSGNEEALLEIPKKKKKRSQTASEVEPEEVVCKKLKKQKKA